VRSSPRSTSAVEDLRDQSRVTAGQRRSHPGFLTAADLQEDLGGALTDHQNGAQVVATEQSAWAFWVIILQSLPRTGEPAGPLPGARFWQRWQLPPLPRSNRQEAERFAPPVGSGATLHRTSRRRHAARPHSGPARPARGSGRAFPAATRLLGRPVEVPLDDGQQCGPAFQSSGRLPSGESLAETVQAALQIREGFSDLQAKRAPSSILSNPIMCSAHVTCDIPSTEGQGDRIEGSGLQLSVRLGYTPTPRQAEADQVSDY